MTMDPHLKDIINQLHESKIDESFSLEFKKATEKLPQSFWETYSSFANTSGGFIILGVNEKPSFKITGVKNTTQMISDLCNTANNSSKVSHNIIENKNIQIHKIDNYDIISVYIPELPLHKKPLYLNGNMKKTYIRKNEGDYLASDEEIRRFLRNAHDDLDSELLDDYVIDDLNTDSILRFKNLIHNKKPSANYLEKDNLSFLTEMGVFQLDRSDNRKEKLTVAGLLFLGKLDAICQKFPHFHLEFINKRNISKDERWKDRVCSGDLNYMNLNLFEYFSIIYEKLRLTITDPFKLDERSIRKTPIELDTALREALANMIVHADYFDPDTDIKVIVDNLDYTFTNPGNMRVSKTQFFTGGQSRPRNNTLIQFFRLLGVSERAGTGGKEILNMAERNRYHLPELHTDSKSTTLKIWVGSPTPAELYPDLTNNACKILSYLEDKTELSSTELRQCTSLTVYFMHKALTELTSKKLIISHGKGRATKYRKNPSIIEAVNAISKIQDYFIHNDN